MSDFQSRVIAAPDAKARDGIILLVSSKDSKDEAAELRDQFPLPRGSVWYMSFRAVVSVQGVGRWLWRAARVV